MVNILLVLLTWIHVLGFVVWLGGAIFFSFILVKNLTVLPPQERGKLMGAVEQQFTPIAWTSLIVIAITGLLIMLLTGSLNIDLLAGTSYGITLLLKIIVFGGIVVMGYMISTTFKKISSASSPEEAMVLQNRIGKISKTNITLGVIAILLAVRLTYGGF
jgi:uncharacterized membrane protein